MNHQLDLKRSKLRSQLFIAHCKNFGPLDEQNYLVPKWSKYIKCNFEREDPAPHKAVMELKKMIETMHTPTKQDFPARKLGNLELSKLQELLPIYEAQLDTKWQNKNTNQAGQTNADFC